MYHNRKTFSNKMKNTQYILLLIIIGFIIASCNKENPDDKITYHYLCESIKPYKFKTGSYWIFQNDITGILDSIVVMSVENDLCWTTPSVHGQPGTLAEFYKMNLKSFATSQVYNDYLTLYYIKRNGGGDYGQNGQPIFMADSDIGDEFNGMEIIEKFPTFAIGCNTFSNVIKTKITASEQYQPMFTNDTYLCFAEDIGLIKKITDLGNGNFDSWSIERWNVIK